MIQHQLLHWIPWGSQLLSGPELHSVQSEIIWERRQFRNTIG